ncbi:MAG: 6-carboxytetrahydropterin synthase [Gammaproteobacteria bacterium]|nr:6-carboxytetrahydropterin synthase [Gammaproteobacteria bacterium]
MKCLECGTERERLDNEHLIACCGFTLQEYAIRHRLPLDLVLHPDQINCDDSPQAYPPALTHPGERARATLAGLRWAGQLITHEPFVDVPGEVRRLDLLLWDLEQLAAFGFRFRQDYEYSADTHRVVARNRLRAPARNLRPAHRRATPEPPPAFLDSLAVYVAHQAEWHAGYLFMQFPLALHGNDIRDNLSRLHGINCRQLDAPDHPRGMLLRTLTPRDTEALLALLRDRLQQIPGAWERFHADTPVASVSKELVFDAAHFITDHPAKCSNLHGGRYQLHVELRGRIDPVTGCVIDYGYVKRVVNQQVVDRFDHHNLNYAAAELAWRSSTEMLCVYIWECLIDYLPALSGLRLYETTQSWCDYHGPTLEAFTAAGSAALLHPFAQVADSGRRQRWLSPASVTLRAAGGHDVS